MRCSALVAGRALGRGAHRAAGLACVRREPLGAGHGRGVVAARAVVPRRTHRAVVSGGARAADSAERTAILAVGAELARRGDAPGASSASGLPWIELCEIIAAHAIEKH